MTDLVVPQTGFNAKAGTPFSGVVAATQGLPGVMKLTLSNAPAGTTMSATGVLSWPVPVKSIYAFQVTASKPGALTASTYCSFTVAAKV